MGVLDRASKVLGDFFGGFQRKAVSFLDNGYAWARRRVSFSYDWASTSGYRGNSLVYACLDAWGTALATAVPEMRSPASDGTGSVIANHPLVELLAMPNEYQTYEEFIYLTAVYWGIAGNAYWQKGYNPRGMLTELWCLRPDWVEPISLPTTNNWIDYYRYRVDGREYHIPPDEMIHLRRGVDPNNPRLGLPPLAAIMSEVGLDQMITAHVTALIENYAVPGVVLSYKKKFNSPQDAEIVKQAYMSKHGAYRRGEPMVIDQDTTVTTMSQDMRAMAIPDLQDVNETRICAAFNVPPIVVGANVGLKRGTYANYAQAREAFWDECIGAHLRYIKGKIRQSLQPEFDTRNIFGWNLSDVRALQEDEEKRRRFYLDAFKAGAILRSDFAKAIGMPAPQDGDYYLIPSAAKERHQGEFPEPPAPLALPPGQAGPRALPPPKALARKQADHAFFAGLTVRLREQLAPGFEAALGKYFDQLGAKVHSRAVRDAAKARTMPGQIKEDQPLTFAVLLAVESLITSKDAADLATLFGDQYALVLELLWGEIGGAIGLHDPYSAGDPFVQEFMQRAAERVTGIIEKTREVLRDNIAAAQAQGYGVDDLIRGVVQDGKTVIKPIRDIVSGAGLYPGIYDRAYAEEYGKQIRRGADVHEAEGLASAHATRAASDYRSLNIARTELGYAANAGSAARYKASGLVHAVRVYDGDGCGWRSHDDPDKANGSIRPLHEAEQYTLAHPSCSRAFGPVVDPSELPEDWGQPASAVA